MSQEKVETARRAIEAWRLDWLLGSSIRSIKVVPRVFAVVASGHPPRSQCTHTEGPRWPQEQ